jgi:hypothetical protein
MEKADELATVCGETTIIDLGMDLSIQGSAEMNNATPLEGSSVIFGEQNIEQDGVTFIQDLLILVDFNNDEAQASNSEEFEWNNDGGGGSTDAKHVKKNQTKSSELLLLKMMMIEVKVMSLTSHFSQISSIEPQGEPELLQFSS